MLQILLYLKIGLIIEVYSVRRISGLCLLDIDAIILSRLSLFQAFAITFLVCGPYVSLESRERERERE